MKTNFTKYLSYASKIWGLLAIEIVISSIEYAILLTSGVAKSTAILVVVICAVVFIFLGFVLFPQIFFRKTQNISSQMNSNIRYERFRSPKKYCVFLTFVASMLFVGAIVILSIQFMPVISNFLQIRTAATMDGWLIVSLLEAFIIGGLLFLLFKIARTLKQEEAERRQEKMKQLRGNGKQVKATVTMVIARGRMQYEIRAQWYGIETDNVYRFSETFWYYRGLLGMHPKITAGDTTMITVNFRSPQIHLIERPW